MMMMMMAVHRASRLPGLTQVRGIMNNVATDRAPVERRRYDGLDLLPIGGRWRPGRSSRQIDDLDPYRGDTLVTLAAASAEDVDEAYREAAACQPGWAAALPQDRREVLLRAAQILIDRRDEIIDWLIWEAGSARNKAAIEWQLVHDGTLEAATYPFRMSGELLPCSVPAKESRVYREPVGVVGSSAPGTSRCTSPTGRWRQRWPPATPWW
jgi:aldehyde dehydrogenase (NAD+)